MSVADALVAVFGEGRRIGVGQECARAVLVLAYGLTAVRLAGRRVFGRWSALDVVVSIVIGSNLSRTLTGGAPLIGTLVATTALLALHWMLARLTARFPAVSHILEGRAVDLSQGEGIDHRVRLHHSVSHADLAEALRQKGLSEAEDAARITLEPSGTINVKPR